MVILTGVGLPRRTSQEPIKPGDLHLLACRCEMGKEVCIDTTGTFGVASATYWVEQSDHSSSPRSSLPARAGAGDVAPPGRG